MTDIKLPAIAKALADDYMELSLINFTMEFYNIYEQFYDGELSFIENGKECLKTAVLAAKNIFSSEEDDETVLAGLNATRKEIIERMEVLTAYTDRFQLHEYLLNRAEKKFESDLPEYDNDDEARKILQFIFEPEDNMEVNLRIKEMLSQIPVRMTTSRFYDLVKDSVTVYKGAERESLNGFIYMIESAAGIYEPKNKEFFKDLEYFKEIFDKADYKNLEKTEFDYLEVKMAELSEHLTGRTDFCIMCQKLLNNLCTYYLIKKYGNEPSAVAPKLEKLILEICKNFEKGFEDEESFEELNIELTDETFTALEGRPEKLVTSISVSEGKLESVREELNAAAPCAYVDFDKASKLMSSSDFADVDAALDVTECTSEIIEEAAFKLLEKLAKELDGKDKQVKRAVIASVLKELPVFFVSHTEVMNYVRHSLEHCKDKAEKAAAIQMFWQVYE